MKIVKYSLYLALSLIIFNVKFLKAQEDVSMLYEYEGGEPIIVLDRSESKKRLAENSAFDIYPSNYRKNEEHNFVGTAQFFPHQLKNILHDLPVEPKNIIIIDLRAESHAFINNKPVSWYKRHNSANHGKSREEIITDENIRLSNHVPGSIVSFFKRNGSLRNKEIVMSTSSEEMLVRNLGADYIRIPWDDHQFPSPPKIELFINHIKNIPENKWIIFHCHAGKGRTTLAMAITEIMRDKYALYDEIIERNTELGGINLSIEYAANLTNEHIRNYYYIRAMKFSEFYDYARETNFEKNYTQWVNKDDASHINSR